MACGEPKDDYCRNCGACQHCGRGGQQMYPYQPWNPYPWYQQPYTWIGDVGNDTITISNADELDCTSTVAYKQDVPYTLGLGPTVNPH